MLSLKTNVQTNFNSFRYTISVFLFLQFQQKKKLCWCNGDFLIWMLMIQRKENAANEKMWTEMKMKWKTAFLMR